MSRSTYSKNNPDLTVSISQDSDDPIYFWREWEADGYLSNWHESGFEEDEVTYVNVEQYMMAQKALLFGDHTVHGKIMNTTSPRTMKKLGKDVTPFNPKTWDDHKEGIVEHALTLKFRADPVLKAQLLATGERELVEASPMDRVWGIGIGKTKAEKGRQHWKGQNLLGKMLMFVRESLREEEE